jgi:hypothetical protein
MKFSCNQPRNVHDKPFDSNFKTLTLSFNELVRRTFLLLFRRLLWVVLLRSQPHFLQRLYVHRAPKDPSRCIVSSGSAPLPLAWTLTCLVAVECFSIQNSLVVPIKQKDIQEKIEKNGQIMLNRYFTVFVC